MYNVIYGVIALVIIAVLVFVFNANFIFLILAILLAVLLWKRNTDLKKNIYKMPEDALHIVNVDKGGVFQLSGVGKNSDELTLKVITKHLYQQGDYYWWELECDKGEGEKVWVEVEDDDDTIVSVVLEKPKFYDISATKEDLVKIDDEEEGSIVYNKVRYTYEDSDEAIFYRYCDNEKPEKFYYWDFENGQYTISIEKWGEKDYEVFYCQRMNPGQVKVLSNKSSEEN